MRMCHTTLEGSIMATRNTKRATKRAPRTIKLSTIYATVAERKGIEVSQAGKSVRSRLRSHFDDYQERFNYPGDGKANRDGNRWPSDVPAKLAKELLS